MNTGNPPEVPESLRIGDVVEVKAKQMRQSDPAQHRQQRAEGAWRKSVV